MDVNGVGKEESPIRGNGWYQRGKEVKKREGVTQENERGFMDLEIGKSETSEKS